MTKEHLIKLIKVEILAKNVKLETLKEKTNESNFGDNLQWNRMEDGAFLEFTGDFLEVLLYHLNRDDVTTALKELINNLESFLLGNSLSGEHGPWNHYSTSPGANRLEIIRCDAARQNRLRAILALEFLTDKERG